MSKKEDDFSESGQEENDVDVENISEGLVEDDDIEDVTQTEWINLFDQTILPKTVLEHIISIKRKGYQIYIDTMEFMPVTILDFPSEQDAKDAMQTIHKLLLLNKISSRIDDVADAQ